MKITGRAHSPSSRLSRRLVNGPLVWQDFTSYDQPNALWVNTIVNENLPGCGKAVSIEFSSTTGEYWRLDGYSMDIEVIGPTDALCTEHSQLSSDLDPGQLAGSGSGTKV